MKQSVTGRRAAWPGQLPWQQPYKGALSMASSLRRSARTIPASASNRDTPSAHQPASRPNYISNGNSDDTGLLPTASTTTAPVSKASTFTSTSEVSVAAPVLSASDLNRSLAVALAEQFQRESLPWIQDLVVPLLEGPPQPLTDTEPPEHLADRDSRFITVHGVRIHYKVALPGEREGPAAVTGARQNGLTRPAAASVASAAAAVGRTSPAAATDAQVSSPSTGSPSTFSQSSQPSSAITTTSSSSLSAAAFPSRQPSPSSVEAGFNPEPRSDPWDSGDPRVTVSVPNPEAAPTLLLMHGLNGSTFNWRLLMDDLAAYVSPSTGGCRVVAYDRPPYGLSQRPLSWRREEDNPYTLEGGARLAAGLLDVLLSGPLLPPQPTHLAVAPTAAGADQRSQGPRPSWGGRRQAVLVGHSAGAAVAVEAALRYPERICGLVLIAPAISTDPRGFLARADLGQLLRFAWTRALLSVDGPGLNYVRRQVMKRKAEVESGRLGIYADEREVPVEVIDGYLRPLRARDWDMGTLLVYRSLQVSGAPPPLDQLRVPVLILQGGEDRTVPLEAAQAVAAALRRRQEPGAVTEMVVLERCGHVPMDEQPLEVLAAITSFVNSYCCDQQS